MTEDEKVDALRTIIAESERLRTLAQREGFDMLAFQLELVLHEARAEIGKRGLPLEPEPPPEGGKVIRLK